jgi:hypothetical protein
MKYTFVVFLAFFITLAFGQKKKTYFPICTFHEKNINIDGISLGLWNFSRVPMNTTTNGIRISLIGEGVLVPLVPSSPIAKNDTLFQKEKEVIISETINGISLSGSGNAGAYVINGVSLGLIGQLTHKMNGLSAALFMNFSQIHNGIQIATFNECYSMTGIQIGFYNSSKRTRGMQFGIWNINERRKLPLINWNFR